MDKDEKDLNVMGDFNMISKDPKHLGYSDRKRARLSSSFLGIMIWWTAFLKEYYIGKMTFKALDKHYHQSDAVSRIHSYDTRE